MEDDWESRVRSSIGRTEQELLKLAHEALRDRRFRLAASVFELVERLTEFEPGRDPFVPAAALASPPGNKVGRRDRSPANLNLPAPSKPPQHRMGGQTYPQFQREADHTLVKVGFSKSEKRTYEHRSPHEVLMRVAEVMASLGSGGPFDTDDLLSADGSRFAGCPTYQVYLCLAFLVQIGLILRHGRQGYTLAPAAAGQLSEAVAAAFAALPRHE